MLYGFSVYLYLYSFCIYSWFLAYLNKTVYSFNPKKNIIRKQSTAPF